MLFPRAASDPIQLGPYTLTECIGQGGMAVVYKAKRLGPASFEKTVVVKAMLPGLVTKKELVDLFRAEARLSAQLNHPNIVQVHDFGVSDQVPYLVMEFLDGRNLTQLRGPLVPVSSGKLPVGAAIAIARDVCLALGYAHEFSDADGTRRQIIHRDVSPSNVMVCRDGTVKLLDFGVAKVAGQFDCDVTQSFRGKYAYMAPEQVNRQPIDRRVDVFAAGIVLHEMLTGKRLFAAPSELETLERVSAAQVVAPSVDAPEVPRALDQIVKRALSRDPAQRYASGAEMAEALEALDAHMFSRRKLARMLIDLFPDVYSVTCEVCGKSVAPGRACSECGTEIPLEGSDPFEAERPPSATDKMAMQPPMPSEPLPLPPPPPPKKKLELVRTPVPKFESPSIIETILPLPDPGSFEPMAHSAMSPSAQTWVDVARHENDTSPSLPMPAFSRSEPTRLDPSCKEPPKLFVVPIERREEDSVRMGLTPPPQPFPPLPVVPLAPPSPRAAPLPPRPIVTPRATPTFTSTPVSLPALQAVAPHSQLDWEPAPDLRPRSSGAARAIVVVLLLAALGGLGAAVMIRRAPPSYRTPESAPIVVVPTAPAASAAAAENLPVVVAPVKPPVTVAAPVKPPVTVAAPVKPPVTVAAPSVTVAAPVVTAPVVAADKPVASPSRSRSRHRRERAVQAEAPATPTSTVREGRIVDPFAGSD